MTTYLEDLSEGLRIETERRVVTAADIDAFVELSGDRNPLHTDDEYARGSGFAGRIAHGLLVLSVESGLSFRRSGRRSHVLPSACCSRHRRMSAWSPESSTSGTRSPPSRSGRV